MSSVMIHGEISADGKSIIIMAAGAIHAVASQAKKLGLITPLISKSDPPGASVVPLSWPAVVQMSFTFGAAWTPGPNLTKWCMDEVSKRCGHGRKELRYQLPQEVVDLGFALYPWQIENAKMVAHCSGGLITDDPGLGKTQSAIVGLAERELWGIPSTPAVVVCPPSVVDSWVRAFQLWAPHWRATAWRGTPAKRAALVGEFDIYVTGYPLARRDAAPGMALGKSPLAKIKPRAVVADEIQNINNPDAVQTRATQRLAKIAECLVPMSGTPVNHNVKGLHPTLEVMEPGAYPSGERFTDRYALELNGDYGSPEIIGLNPHNEPEFRTSLLGRMTRHNKTACLPDLPPKVYSIRHVELPPQYLKVYRDMEAKMIAEMPDGQELTVMGVLAQIVRLQQLSSAAADVETYEELDEKTGEIKVKQKVTLKFPSWKVDALLEVLAERPGQPVVCFAPSRQLIMLAGQAAAAQGLRVGHIVGGQTPAERTASIDTFQAGGLDLLCATTQAGGTGLTLTAAGTFVFLQRPYSLVESLQAEDRGHRIGTLHDSIEIIDIYATGTIDSAIRSVLHDKADQLGELLRDPAIVSGLFGGLSARKPARHLVAVS